VGLLALRLGYLSIELAPLLFGPAQLLHGGGEVEEMDRNDRGPGTEICVADEGIELSSRLDEAGVDLLQAF
jgi:hypothetical protein